MAREDQLSHKKELKESRKKWGKRYGQSWLGDAPDEKKAATKSAPKTAKAVRSTKSSSSAPSKSKRPPKDSYTKKLSDRVESALNDDRKSGGPRRGSRKTTSSPSSSGPTSRPNNRPSDPQSPKVEKVSAGASKSPDRDRTQGQRIRDGIRKGIKAVHEWGQSDNPFGKPRGDKKKKPISPLREGSL